MDKLFSCFGIAYIVTLFNRGGFRYFASVGCFRLNSQQPVIQQQLFCIQYMKMQNNVIYTISIVLNDFSNDLRMVLT